WDSPLRGCVPPYAADSRSRSQHQAEKKALALARASVSLRLLAAEQRAQERDGDATLRGEGSAVDAVEQVEQGREVALAAREQPVEHAVVEVEAARGRAFAQYVAALDFIERLQGHLGAGRQSRHQVRQ